MYGQNMERKIIIEDEQFHFITVDEDYQIATLYKGKLDEPLNDARAYALPVGRNTTAQLNPLAWELENNTVVAVSFLDHPLNDRNEAIKRFSLADVHQWSPAVTVGDMVQQSADNNMFVINQPYLFWKDRTKYFNHFYFDGVLVGDKYWHVTTNNGELKIWYYSDDEWNGSALLNFPVEGYFSLVEVKDKLALIDSKGLIYTVTINGLERAGTEVTAPLRNITLIENKDTKAVYFIQNDKIDRSKNMMELLTAAQQIKL